MWHWLYLEFWWALHNLIAHPLSQVLRFVSLCGLIRPIDELGNWLHDWTVPIDVRGQGRG